MKRSRTKSKSTRHSYDIESGTREALAYDSLKSVNSENDYNKFASTEMMLYRITSSLATLCAGLTLWLGYKRAYEIDIFFGIIAMGFAFGLKEISVDDNEHSQYSISQKLKEVITESINFLVTNKKARAIMFLNALIGAVSTLVLFFLQAKLPLAGLNEALLGPALFVMGLGAAFGAKIVEYFPKLRYRKFILFSGLGVLFAFCMVFTGNPYVMIVGGCVGSFVDDFLEVRTDVILNDMIPSGQRATLISVSSFTFSLVMIVMSTLMGSIM